MKKILITLFVIMALAGCSDDLKTGSEGGSGTGDSDSNNGSGTDITSDADADSDSDSDSDIANGNCADINWDVDVKVINMLVLLDRSYSMFQNSIDKETYAEVVQKAINQVVESNIDAGVINFSLNVFPSDKNCTATYIAEHPNDADAEIQCEAASGYSRLAPDAKYDAPTVPFQAGVTMNTYNLIEAALEKVGQCGGTPICDSLAWAKKYLQDSKMPINDTYVLLATDGAPNCNSKLDQNTCKSTMIDDSGKSVPATSPLQCIDDTCAYNQAQALALSGYKTFVIGVGNDVQAFSDILDGLAYRGQTNTPVTTVPPSDTPYFYPATDADALNASFEKITNQVIDCQYDVNWGTVPDKNADGTSVIKRCDSVNLTAQTTAGGTVTIAYSAVDDAAGAAANCDNESAKHPGWYWVEQEGKTFDEITDLKSDVSNCSKIQLCPIACENLKASDGTRNWQAVNAAFGCESVIITSID
ncbi:MAG: VWA domain-containing protein [Deltaproteobacteria bacterium]|nr:VWA domain-containing protein [Deltaproteobacteria bacterium]